MDVNVETEAVGSVLNYRPDRYPVIERYALADGRDGSELCVPDPQRAARMPEMLKANCSMTGSAENTTGIRHTAAERSSCRV